MIPTAIFAAIIFFMMLDCARETGMRIFHPLPEAEHGWIFTYKSTALATALLYVAFIWVFCATLSFFA